MNDDTENSSKPDAFAPAALGTATATTVRAKYFFGADWLSFWLTAILALAVYLWTLAPNLTLGWSGMFAVGAMYAGVPFPPGYPLWTLYAWPFTKLLPFSNIAWRVSLSSAVAGALACGVIALIVSRGGALILEGIHDFRRLAPKEENQLRVASGVVAGLGVGFDKWLWGEALIVSTWPLSILLLCVTIVLLMKWFYTANRRRYLYAAFFVYGLTFTNSQILFAAAFGLQVIVMCAQPVLRREICFANSLFFVAGLLVNGFGYFPVLERQASEINLLQLIFCGVGIGSIAVCVWLTAQTRQFLTEWKPVFAMGGAFLLGLAPHLYLPIASMTNPPANWGYARTVQGFWHLVTRGQFERLNPTGSFSRFVEQLGIFGDFAAKDLGWLYVIAALIPFCFLHRMQSRDRRWMFGLLAVFLCLSLLMLVVLNPPTDGGARELVAVFFTGSHLVMAVWAGYGLILLGSMLAREKTAGADASSDSYSL